MRFLSVLSILAFTITSASGQGLGTKIAKQGNWTIFRSQDAMTDEISCVAIFKNDPSVQLTLTSLGFNLNGKGGVSGFTDRVDDNPPSEMQLPSHVEEQAGVIVIKDAAYSQIMQAKRFRIQVLTVLPSNVNFDVDLKDSAAVLKALDGPKCHK